MVQLKKRIQLSAFLVLCQSPYFLCAISSLNPVLIQSIQSSPHILLDLNETKTKQLINSSLTNFSSFINTIISNHNKKRANTTLSQENNHQVNSNKEDQGGEYIMCEAILSSLKKHNISQSQFQLIIPINLITLTSFSILFALILLGSFYVWKVLTSKKCLCPLCKGIYRIIEKVDEGGFGEIYKVQCQESLFVLKRCKLDNISEADDLLLEAKHLRTLSHRNIVKFHDDFLHIEYQHGHIEPIVFVVIIMEYCQQGDLKNLIDSRFYSKQPFSKEEIIDILMQLSEGLSYLHHKNIIHRDIKSQNVFFTKGNILRIGDFGLAKKLRKKKQNTNMTRVGTESYMAPEVIRNENYGLPVDIWSLGCVIEEMCTLNFIWQYDTAIGVEALSSNQFLQPFLNDIKDEENDYGFFKELLQEILVLNPEKRITIDVLVTKLKKEKIKMNQIKVDMYKSKLATII